MKPDTLPTDDGRRTWDRHAGETPAAFAAFVVYLDLGEGRSVAQAYRRHRGKPDALRPSGRFVAWARAHDWFGRADAYDVHVRRERVKAFLAVDLSEQLDALRMDAVELAESEIRHSRRLRVRAERMMERHAERLESPDYKPTVRDIVNLFSMAKLLGESGINARGAALGIDQLHGLLNGEVPMDLSAALGNDGRRPARPFTTKGEA